MGVHRQCRRPPGGPPVRRPRLVQAPRLAEILRPYEDDIEIVISSWWAYHRPLDEIRSLLPASLAAKVIDSIWLSELITSAWSDYQSKLATRHACIRLWLKRRRPGHEHWLALDDDTSPWPWEDEGRLVRARGTLADPKVQRDLVERLETALR